MKFWIPALKSNLGDKHFTRKDHCQNNLASSLMVHYVYPNFREDSSHEMQSLIFSEKKKIVYAIFAWCFKCIADVYFSIKF